MFSSWTGQRRTIGRLAARVPGLIAGAGPGGVALLDVDDTIREVHGFSKQVGVYSYTGQRGLNVQLATICTPTRRR